MKNTPTTSLGRFGQRLHSGLRAGLLVLALAALTVPAQLFAQAPTFNTLITTSANTGSIFPESAAVGDFNGDGKSDAIITVGASNTFRLMLGNGTGAFSVSNVGLPQITLNTVVELPPSLMSFVTSSVSGFGAVQAADVNLDGKLDVICVENVNINFVNYSFIGVLINTGNDANGVPQFAATHHYAGAGIRPLTLGDLNGDGRVDFITGNAWGGNQVWLGNGSGTFTSGQSFGLFPGLGNPSAGLGAIADLNGDGKADYVVTSNQNGGANIFLGNGDGTFQTAATYLPNQAVSVVVADVNSDGLPDLLMGDLTTGSEGLRVYLNNGGGTFGSPTVFSTGGLGGWFHGGGSVAVSDINGDGKLDVALSNLTNNTIAVLLGDGNGSFGAPAAFSAGSSPTYVFVDDFNSDGKPDIGAILRNSRQFGVLQNTTVFAPPLPTQTLTILGGSGSTGDVATNVEYYNAATGNWQPAYLAYFPGHSNHPWGVIAGTNHWINYKANGNSDPGASDWNTLWYLYRVRFTVPSDAVEAKMTFSLKADNRAQVAINGVNTGPIIVGAADQLNADAVFAQNVHPGENIITLNVGDEGGLNGFNFRIDLSVKSAQPLEIVPVATDTTPPVISAPSNIITEATGPSGAVVSFAASAVDAVDGSVPVLAIPPSGSTFALGTTTVDLGASDAAGNIATTSFNVTVRDTTPPAITAPANATAEASSAAGAVVTFAASAVDIVDGSVPVLAIPSSGSTFALGTSTVDLGASDVAGNFGSATFTVTVVDTTAPVLSVPANQTIEAASAAGAVANFSATATDAVGVTTITYSAASGSIFGLGTSTVTVTAKDAAGNSATGSFTITVQDTTAPVISSVTPSISSIWPPNHKMVPIKVTAVSSDSVGITSLKIISVTSNEPDNGLGDGDTANDIEITGDMTVNLRAERSGKGNGRIYTITVEAKDAAGNASTKTTTVSVPKSQKG
ncbi:MAG: FG-GAP-like repeat-containing protein [Candidatus Didemnitutus sp.]|nr:FG-GAP-like repeat-containing protein [Candidatus Didemnitutus sp.]